MVRVSHRTLRQVSRLSVGARADLLRVLTAPSDVRADVIRQSTSVRTGERWPKSSSTLRRMSCCASRRARSRRSS
jgi:hypothetical protein